MDFEENRPQRDLGPRGPQLYNQVWCRKCFKLIQDCRCKPIPCPFCEEEIWFVQDWNAHLDEKHQELLEYLEKEWLR